MTRKHWEWMGRQEWKQSKSIACMDEFVKINKYFKGRCCFGLGFSDVSVQAWWGPAAGQTSW